MKDVYRFVLSVGSCRSDGKLFQAVHNDVIIYVKLCFRIFKLRTGGGEVCYPRLPGYQRQTAATIIDNEVRVEDSCC